MKAQRPDHQVAEPNSCRTEDVLQQQGFQSLIQNLQVGVLLQGANSEILLSNRAALDLLGLDEDQLLGKTSFDPNWRVVHEDGSPFPGETHPVPVAIATGQPVHNVIMGVYRPKFNDQVWLLVNANPQFDSQGQVKEVICTFSDITEPKRIEEALQKSEAQNRALLNAIPDLLFRVDQEGTYLDVRPAKSFGTLLPSQDMIGKSEFDVLPPAIAQKRKHCLKRALETGETQFCEYQIKLPDGIHDEEARIVASGANEALIIIRDVTERKQAEAALQQAEEKYRSIFENAIEGIFQTTPDGRHLSANPALARIYGYASSEDLIASLTDIEHQLYVDPARRREFIQIIEAEGVVSGFESQIYQKNGSQIWISENAHAVYDDGHLLYYEGTVSDITVRKQAQIALARSEAALAQRERYLAALVTIQNWLLTCTNEQNLYSKVLEPLGEVSGASRVYLFENHRSSTGDLLMSQRAEWCAIDIEPEIDNPVLQNLSYDNFFPRWAEMLSKGEVIAGIVEEFPESEQLILQPQGILSILVLPLFVSGEFFGFIGFDNCLEPHAWTASEIDLLRAAAAAISLAQERRQATAALEQARQEAEHSSHLKSTFLAIMSHEIRTPMNAVLGMTELLTDTELSAEQRDFVETIQTSGETLLALINQILDFSKLEAGEMELEVLDFDLNHCIEEVADLLATSAHTKGLELATLVYRNLPTRLRGDAHRIKQVLTNLVSNAIKFTDMGEVMIQASLKSETLAAATISISVTDTGIGISPTAQKKLFQPFSQVDVSTTRRYGGTGLGLAISKQLVELMGGEIGVESVEGRGSRFWITLTLEKQLTHAAMELPTIASKLDRTRLLIVDDTATNRKILRYQVSAWGIQTDEAETATAALHCLKAGVKNGRPYDLVILDMQMPEMDGEMLGCQIKADPLLAHTKLIMMTSLNHRSLAKQVLQLGFSAYLVKPVKQSRLFDCIVSVLADDPNYYSPIQTRDDKANLLQATIAPNTTTTNGPVKLTSVASEPSASLKVLLVEDNTVNQKVTLNQLKRLGYDADVAANGQEALGRFAQKPYDIVLMDCQMPILDGYQATQEIRHQDGEARHTIIIALTANAMKEDRERCLNAGMDDYLSKPILKEELAEKLTYWSQVLLKQNRDQSAIALKATVAPKRNLLHITQPRTLTLDSVTPIDRIINWDHLHKISDGNSEFELEILETYVRDTHLHLVDAETAITNSDFYRLEHAAHHIKGASANVGLTPLQVIADELEQQARQQWMGKALDLVNQLHQLLHSVQSFLAELE